MIAAKESFDKLTDFIVGAIRDHEASDLYKTAVDAELYARQQNVTINRYRKLLYTITGEAVPDNFTANHKCASNFLRIFVEQENQFLLGNGVIFDDETIHDKLGRDFDNVISAAGWHALIDGLVFVFWNYDHAEMFDLQHFVPIYDEESGALRAGIRYWQIDGDKPLRLTLYEEDGFTDYIRRKGEAVEEFHPKRTYIQIRSHSEADGDMIYDGGNYPSFPIVPFWGNNLRQSELVGMRENIDCYDLIKSGFANDLDDASMIYWALQNCGGMDDTDLAKFKMRMKTLGVANMDGGDDGARAEPHTVEVPHAARDAYLTRLESDLYRDARALNVSLIGAGNTTATQINAAYEPLNNKADAYEYCAIDCICGILDLIGVHDVVPRFKRSRIVNQSEETTMVLSAAEYLDEETVLHLLPFVAEDDVEDILRRKTAEESARFASQSGNDDGRKDERMND